MTDEIRPDEASTDTAVRRFSPQDLFDILKQLDACKQIPDLRDTLMACLRPFGFIGFSIAIDRKLKSMSVHAGVLTTWPDGVNEDYVSSGLFHTDPVMLQSHRATMPFAWDMSIYNTKRKEHAQIVKIRTGLGATGGVVVPVMEGMGGRTVMFLSGTRFPSCVDTLLVLRVLLEHLLSRMHLIRANGIWNEPMTAFVRDMPLTRRERQVMGWIAFGKSSREVAAIMGISEHTVNEHIARAVGKLKASNRTEAVALAMMTDDIER